MDAMGAWLAAAGVLAVGVVVAAAAAIAVRFAARRLGIEKARAGRLANVAFWAIVAIVAVAALAQPLDQLGVGAGLSSAIGALLRAVPGVLAAVFLLVIGVLVAAALRRVITSVLARFTPGAAEVLGAVVYWLVIVVVTLTAAEQLGLETAVVRQVMLLLIGGLIAAFALGLGLGTRDLFAAIAAGRHVATIVRVGDDVTIGRQQGTVTALGHASVRLAAGGEATEVPNTRFLQEDVRVRRA